MWASAPTKNNVRFQRRGRCPHRPVGYDTGAVKKERTRPYRWLPGRCGHRPLQKQRAFSALGAMPSSPRWVCLQSGQKRRTRPYRRLPGRCGHRPLRKTMCVFSVGGVTHKNNVCFQRRGRCPHRPAGCVTGAVRKNGHAHTVGIRADEGIGPYKIKLLSSCYVIL